VVSTGVHSWWGCLRPPCGGTLATVPSRIFSSACCTPSPETSRVMEGFSSFFRDLVDLVDVNNALLGALHIAAGILQELQNDIFNIFANISCFRQGGGIGNGKRHFQHAGQGLGQQGLARARRPNQQDIGFGQLHVAANARQNVALVVVVNGHGKLLLGFILAHHVLVEKRLDLRRGAATWLAWWERASLRSSSRMLLHTATHSSQM
jgi:hypothetical protein